MIEWNASKLDAIVDSILHAARIPGVAIAVVTGMETIFAKGYGYRDLEARLPTTPDTAYPIASTTKAINATLIGMLVDERRLAWDAPVQSYFPQFRLRDPCISAQVTLRDLLAMRTGLPRHDWSWSENPTSRSDLVERLRYLEPSSGFCERFQYNNLTVTAAGHVAEVVTGKNWEQLVQQRLLDPIGMRNTGFTMAPVGDVTLSYHENRNRQLIVTKRRATEVTAPSGGVMHSTIRDMTLWMSFNLNGGKAAGVSLIRPETLTEIRSPQTVVGGDPSAPTPHATYAMGWFVDTYNGCERISHSGYLQDVSSNVMLFPNEGIGLVSFANFGAPVSARLINDHAFDSLMGFKVAESVEKQLAQYEKKIEGTRARNASVRRIHNASPSHTLNEYAGIYAHPGYGQIEIYCDGQTLTYRRNNLSLALEHLHYDVWVFADNELFPIHNPHAFDRASYILFEINPDGKIAALSIQLEPAVFPLRFVK